MTLSVVWMGSVGHMVTLRPLLLWRHAKWSKSTKLDITVYFYAAFVWWDYSSAATLLQSAIWKTSKRLLLVSVLRIKAQGLLSAFLFRTDMEQGEIVIHVRFSLFQRRSVGLFMSVLRCVLRCEASESLKWPATLPQWKAETWRAGWREEVLKPDIASAYWAIKRLLAPLFPSSCLWLCTCGYVFFFFLKFVFLYLLAKGARPSSFIIVRNLMTQTVRSTLLALFNTW